MKRIILILVLVFILLALFGGIIFFVFKKATQRPAPETWPTPTPEGVLIETKLEERPFVSITPSDDGHWLTLEITQIKNADILEYELSYNTDKGNQGSVGYLKLEGKTFYEKRILLGTESSGHFRYDEGVTQGNLVVRFRQGKEVRKFTTDFHLQKGGTELSSLDGQFKIQAKLPTSTYFVTMPTVGLPSPSEAKVLGQPYGVFSSTTKIIKPAGVSLEPQGDSRSFQVYFWDGKSWLTKPTSAIGVFVMVTSE